MSTARAISRTAKALVATCALTLSTVGVANAASSDAFAEAAEQPVQEASLNLGLAYGGSVGLVTVALGLGGLVLGVVRRRKVSRRR